MKVLRALLLLVLLEEVLVNFFVLLLDEGDEGRKISDKL